MLISPVSATASVASVAMRAISAMVLAIAPWYMAATKW